MIRGKHSNLYFIPPFLHLLPIGIQGQFCTGCFLSITGWEKGKGGGKGNKEGGKGTRKGKEKKKSKRVGAVGTKDFHRSKPSRKKVERKQELVTPWDSSGRWQESEIISLPTHGAMSKGWDCFYYSLLPLLPSLSAKYAVWLTFTSPSFFPNTNEALYITVIQTLNKITV